MQGGESVRAMGRDLEGVITRSAMMKRGRETEHLQGQMCVVCCSYQDRILSRKKMLCYLFPLFHLDGASVCVCKRVKECVVFVYVRELDGFCMRVCQYFKCVVHEQFWTKS